jgi:hypothetical protein
MEHTTMAKAAPQTLPNNAAKPVQAKEHASTIEAKRAFTGVIERVLKASTAIDDAKADVGVKTEAQNGLRVTLLCDIATAAVAGNWSHDHAVAGLNAAIEAYATAYNASHNLPLNTASLKQFAGECGRAIHPKAREHVAAEFAKADDLWAAEGDVIDAAKAKAIADETKFRRADVDTPLRDRFKRKYHMVVGSNGLLAARANENLAELADSPEMLAEQLDTNDRQDHKRAARAIAKAVATIEEIADEFPSQRWDVTIKFLKGIKPETLVTFRDAQKREQRRERANAPQRTVAPSATVTADAVNAAADEMME